VLLRRSEAVVDHQTAQLLELLAHLVVAEAVGTV
jgi:hypothetical protein